MAPRVFYVGTESEVAHHAQPLLGNFDVEIVEPSQVVEKAGPADLAIFYSEHFERFRTAVVELKAKGCRTLYAIDGILEWRNAFENRESEPACPWTMRPVLCHKVAAIGRSQARILDFWGNKNKIELIGLPRLDSLSPASTEKVQGPHKRIMVMTAKWPAFTDDQQTAVEKSLSCIKRYLDSRDDVEVIWRLTGGLDEQLQIDNAFQTFNKDELVDQLQGCDALITTPSTAMLEGALLAKPTAILEFNDCPQLIGSAWQIRHEDQVKSVVEQLLTPSKAKLAQQDFWLHDTLECRTSATDRLVQLISRMFEFDADRIPEHLVEIDSPDTFAKQGKDFLYNNHRLFETDETLETETQLAFLQREVKRLQERNELIESEFEKAKSTIDHVFNNPVVSPFIKAGEFAGKLFTKKKSKSTE